jgi:hypothetical protein
MAKETGELNSLGSYFSRYSLSPKGLWREAGAILKNFHPSGEPIWPHPLRCGPFAVPKYSFMARRLAAAVTLTREMPRIVSTYKCRLSALAGAIALRNP